jgi:hypothetical protein
MHHHAGRHAKERRKRRRYLLKIPGRNIENIPMEISVLTIIAPFNMRL